MKIGASDKITERILNYMSDPIHLPDNKKAYLGVMQVSMLPGWRTRKGYVCEVQVNFEFALSNKRALPQWQDRFPGIQRPPWISSQSQMAIECGLPSSVPTVISAFPFAETQILDLSSSYQRQLNLLLQFAAAIPQVPGLQAALSASFQKMLKQDVSTRTALPLVIPSSQGSDVTYRFDPELLALVDPASTKSGPGQLLEPSSFPALVVIICDEEDLLTWDSISASVETRWMPSQRCDCPEKTFSNEERLHNAHDFDAIANEMQDVLQSNLVNPNEFAYQELERRFENLKTTAMGHTLYSSLPLLRPHILDVYPKYIRKDNMPNELVIQGQFFKSKFSDLKDVGLNGINLTNGNRLITDGHLITVHLSAEEQAQLRPGKYTLSVVTSTGSTDWTNAICVESTPAPVISDVVAPPISAYGPKQLEIAGQHFLVGDKSRRVTVGGIALGNPHKVTDDSILYTDLSPLVLAPGKYDVEVTTSGGKSVMPGALTISLTNPAAVPPVVTVISPNKFRLDDEPSSLEIYGAFSSDTRGLTVRLGPQKLNIMRGKEDHLVASIPDDLKSLLKATNYDLEVANAAGRTIMTNAISVLPIPAPVITALLPSTLQITTNTGTSTNILAIEGDRFGADSSYFDLRINGNVISTDSILTNNNNLILLNVTTNLLKGKTGKLDLTLRTAGAIWSKATRFRLVTQIREAQ